MKVIALTGATGFIGRVLLKHLTDQGYCVKALYRQSSSPPPTAVNSVEWIAGSLEDSASLRTLVTDVDGVVHCAGAVRGVTLKDFQKINTEGVRQLLQISVEQGGSRFLLVSSLAARESSLSHYALSKKLGEDILSEYSDRISWSILRPPAVYGPGDREMLPLLKLLRRGFVPIVGSKTGRFSLLYVDDLAAAIVCLLRSGQVADRQCFELHDGRPNGYTWGEIAAIATQLNGKPSRCFSFPRGLISIIGRVNITAARLFSYQPMLTPGKVKEIFHPDWVCDNSRITQTIDWQPEILFADGMKRLFY